MTIEYKNVIFGVDKTEAEIYSLGLNSIIKGQMWIASDTKRIIGRDLSGAFYRAKSDIGNDVPKNDGKYYVRSNESWVDITTVIDEFVPVDWKVKYETSDFTAEHRTVHLTSTSTVKITCTIPDAEPDIIFEARPIKITAIETPAVDVVTTGGQNIGGKTVQSIYGSSEGFWVLSNSTNYVLIQDNRGGVPRLLSQSTTIISGFDITLNGDNTIDVGEGLYVIEDPSDLNNPISEPKHFLGHTGYVISGASVRGATTVYLTENNQLQQVLNDTPSPETQITQPRIAVMVHLTADPIVTEVAYWWTTGNNPSSRINELLDFFGVMKRGIVFSGDPVGNLKLAHSEGSLFAAGLETNFTPKRTDRQYIAAQSPVPGMLYATQTEIFDPITDVDVTQYDVGGTLTPIGGSSNQCTIHRIIVLLNGGIAIQPGQQTYANLAEATEALSQGLDEFVINPVIGKFSIIGAYLIAEKGATDLTDSANATFIQANLLGELGGGSGSGAPSVSEYTHNHGYGRKGTTNNPNNTDVDLPHIWFEEDTAQWGFDGEGGSPDRTVRAVVSGNITAFGVNTEFLGVDVEFGVKIDGVKHSTTWTVTAALGHLEQVISSPIPYSAGQSIIPYVRYDAGNWNGIGITCELYTRGTI